MTIRVGVSFRSVLCHNPFHVTSSSLLWLSCHDFLSRTFLPPWTVCCDHHLFFLRLHLLQNIPMETWQRLSFVDFIHIASVTRLNITVRTMAEPTLRHCHGRPPWSAPAMSRVSVDSAPPWTLYHGFLRYLPRRTQFHRPYSMDLPLANSILQSHSRIILSFLNL